MSFKTHLECIAQKFSEKEKVIFLLITVATGIIALWPLHNFQNYLAPGDHGRDLYCFKQTLDGALPYRDYSWLFGPLMPYYYALCYLLGGISIQSILLGQGLLILLSGAFIYLICASFLPPFLSFVCAYWYWSYRGAEFFYTYNHIGGILALLVALYCALKYMRSNSHRHIYIGFISVFCLMLIRLNMGAFILLAFTGSLLLIDFVQKNAHLSRQRKLYIFLSLATLGSTFLIYWFLLHGLPNYAIYQSFPYAKSQRTDASGSIFYTLQYAWGMIVAYFTATSAQKILGVILSLSLLQSSIFIFSKKSSQELKKKLVLIFSILFLFLFFGSHEYIASGVFYRLYWIFPLIFIILFTIIGIGTKNITSPLIKILIAITLLLPAAWNMQVVNRSAQNFKNPFHELKIGKNHIYTLQHPLWFRAVYDSVSFIKTNVPPNEKVLALPFDPLYLFLSERESASRQLVFFEHIGITEEQELKIIENMERDGTDWAVISNRSYSTEGGMGTLGKTYCLLLSQYLVDHFETVATFGDWTNPGGWAWNHGTKILKRK